MKFVVFLLILFVVSPHADDFDRFCVIQNLIDETMLNANTTGEGAAEIPYENFIWRRRFIGILFKIFKGRSAFVFRPLTAILFASFLACLV